METPNNVKWAIGLSDGNNAYEGKGRYEIKQGGLSPYQRLLKDIKDSGVFITSLSLFTDDGRTWNLPAIGRNPKFRIFNQAEKPMEYRFFRTMGADIMSGQPTAQDKFAVIEAIYLNRKLQIWVDENNPDNSWSVII